MNEAAAPLPTAEQETTREQPRPAVRWSWLQFFLLALILIGGLLALNIQQSLGINALGRQQHETAVQLAADQRHESQLASYIDSISNMLLHDNLLDSKAGDPTRLIANARTQEVLLALDPDRNATILRYLYTTKLINNDRRVIDMAQTDLRGAHLSAIDLRDTYLLGANMSGADLRKANLTFTMLIFTNLSGADLRGADLQASDLHNVNLNGANLAGANLKDAVGLSSQQLTQIKSLAGAIMPDGSKHP